MRCPSRLRDVPFPLSGFVRLGPAFLPCTLAWALAVGFLFAWRFAQGLDSGFWSAAAVGQSLAFPFLLLVGVVQIVRPGSLMPRPAWRHALDHE